MISLIPWEYSAIQLSFIYHLAHSFSHLRKIMQSAKANCVYVFLGIIISYKFVIDIVCACVPLCLLPLSPYSLSPCSVHSLSLIPVSLASHLALLSPFHLPNQHHYFPPPHHTCLHFPVFLSPPTSPIHSPLPCPPLSHVTHDHWTDIFNKSLYGPLYYS